MDKPNILFVFSDQHRKFEMGCYGNDQIITPHLDDLAKGGRRFEHCISNSPVCVPARGSLLTSLFPQKHGAFTNDISIHYHCESVADVLVRAGWHTGYIGKWHLSGIPRNQAIPQEHRLGFQEWKVANCNHDYLNCYYDDESNIRHEVFGYEPEVFGKLAVDFIERQTSQKTPWALYLAFATPHDPFEETVEHYSSLYQSTDLRLRKNIPDTIQKNKNATQTKKGLKEQAKGYYRHITAIDDQIGALIDALTQTGQLENTIIVYTSDHGEMLGSQGLSDKQQPYEESIAVPLIVAWPNRIIAGVSEEMIGLVDLPSSILGLLGLSFAQETDGENLSRLLKGSEEKGKQSCYIFDLFPCHQAYLKGYTAWRGVRSKRYTYAITPEYEWLLFDNEKDPYQQDNLIKNLDYAPIKKEMAQMLNAYLTKNDALMSGTEYVEYCHAQKEFDVSQQYFNFPILEELKKYEKTI